MSLRGNPGQHLLKDGWTVTQYHNKSPPGYLVICYLPKHVMSQP